MFLLLGSWGTAASDLGDGGISGDAGGNGEGLSVCSSAALPAASAALLALEVGRVLDFVLAMVQSE
jgi:hypothetical protein